MALAGHRKVLAVKNKGVAKPAAVVKAEPVIIRGLVNPSGRSARLSWEITGTYALRPETKRRQGDHLIKALALNQTVLIEKYLGQALQ